MKKSKKRARPRRLIEFPDDLAIIPVSPGDVLVDVQLVPLITFADDIRDHYSVPISDDECCRDNKRPAKVKIDSIALSQNRASLVVAVSASHPCGMETVIVLAADEVTKEVKPGIVSKEIVPREAGGKRIEDRKDFACADKVRSVTPRLNVPTADLVGTKPFRIVAYAYPCCEDQLGVTKSKGEILLE